ncbi:MAG: hypothetical protein FP816_12745 [Desulfobacteraceae bacterium]|nr:hypothetical protein [Desulfobacteraceae bacterium]MBU4001215.1 hypothetical protein [Pseudomonadota bacterium]MBU4055100.1 hypothetical protein [Pseudomonadota bacterium]
MIAEAIIKDGGLFIPGVEDQVKVRKDKVTIQFTILDGISLPQHDPFIQAAGILKGRIIDPLKYQKELRDEWGH